MYATVAPAKKRSPQKKAGGDELNSCFCDSIESLADCAKDFFFYDSIPPWQSQN